MWRPIKQNTAQGWSAWLCRYIPHNGAPPDQQEFLVGQPGWVAREERLNSEDGRKDRGDKVCEHYVYTSDLHLCQATYAATDLTRPIDGPYYTFPCAYPEWFWGQCAGAGGVRGYDRRYGRAEYPVMGLPPLYDDTVNNGRKVLPTIDVSKYVERSLAAILPIIRPQLSIVNTILELKDFKSLARSIASASNYIDRIAGRVTLERRGFINQRIRLRARGKPTRLQTLRELVRGGSDGYLQWMFGLAPLLSDLRGIHRALRETRHKIDQILAHEGKDLVHHHRSPMSEYSDVVDYYDLQPPYNIKGKFRNRRYVTYHMPMFQAALAYRYNLSEWERTNAVMAGYLDSFGLNLNPAIVWNAVRWSFIVDWVAGVGQWLDQFKTANLEPVTHITRYCISLKVKRTILTTFQVVEDNAFGTNTGEIPVSTFCEEAYFRTPWLADWLRSFNTSGLSSREFSLAAALAFSR